MEEFGSKPEDILVGIGPCINSCCYEVDAPVISRLKEAFSYWDELVTEAGEASGS